ncbi:YIP1 family protein [uncultured Lentibacter sp.]|jgi:hypothetical protein|uniref:YIP1 family protein n=1 Tax=uncultured Lentibacter sp. TaxID=1659309 RepID=UPI002616B92F|nr:YIP1 family protein [uncultured Lentibacter sp.]
MDIRELVKATLLQPVAAAQTVMALNLSRDVLWLALLLAAVLNALLFSLGFQAQPPQGFEGLSAEETAQITFMISYFSSPLRVAVTVALALVMSVFAFLAGGRMLGGQGRLEGVLAVLTWWQFVGLAMSLAILGLGFVSLALAQLLSFLGNIWLLYALIGLLSGAHHFESLIKGIGTVALSLLLMAVGLLFLLTLIGLIMPSGVAHV